MPVDPPPVRVTSPPMGHIPPSGSHPPLVLATSPQVKLAEAQRRSEWIRGTEMQMQARPPVIIEMLL